MLSDNILSYFDILQYKSILDFAVQDVKLDEDISSPKSRVDLDNAPHIVEPLSRCVIDKNKRKTVVIAFPEQMGKTLIQMIALLYNSVYNKMQSIVLYPSIELAVQTNATKLIPLFKSIPQFKKDLELPFAIRSDRLRTSNNLIYFGGAGTKCVSRSCKMTCADEAAVWVNPPNVDNLVQLQKRTRSYSESLNLIVSTPTYKDNSFWQHYLNSSQGYYYLRCYNCNQLSMRSADIHNLQFQSVYNEEMKIYQVKHGTCRLVCPKCHYQHKEEQKEWMIKNGGYIHKYQDKVQLNPGYQCGVLASLLNTHNWDVIADVQLLSGKSASLEQYMSFDNSYRGLPLQQHNYNKQSQTQLSNHFFDYSELLASDIEAIVVSADTQDVLSVYSVIALTRNNNYYVIDCGRVRFLFLDDEERKIINAENKRNNKEPQVTLLDILERQYYGIKPLCMLVDSGGHRGDQIKNFSRIKKNILMYKGTSLKFDTWRVSQNNSKLFLCDFKKTLAEYIFMLNFNKNKESNYLFIHKDISQQDKEEILSFKPDNTKRNGNLLENWTCEDRIHDMADTIRMGITAFKIASKIYKKQRFRLGEAKILNMNKNPLKKEVKKPLIKKPIVKRNIFSY